MNVPGKETGIEPVWVPVEALQVPRDLSPMLILFMRSCATKKRLDGLTNVMGMPVVEVTQVAGADAASVTALLKICEQVVTPPLIVWL